LPRQAFSESHLEVRTRGKHTHWAALAAKLSLWPLALLTLTMLAFQFGVWSKEITFAGPFTAETSPAQRTFVLSVPQEDRVPWWRQPLIGDTGEKPTESRLKLRINNVAIGPPHSVHKEIREGRTGGFSHWRDHVVFALPRGVANDASTTLTLRYSIAPRPWVVVALLIATLLPMLRWHKNSARRIMVLLARSSQMELLATSSQLVLAAILILGLIGAAAFLGSSFYAFAANWALPTTALIRGWPLAEWAALNEPYLPYFLLVLASFGAVTTWLCHVGKIGQASLGLVEQRLVTFASWAGFPLAICAYVFCSSAIWTGMVRPGDPGFVGIGSLIPYSDALNHLAGAFDQARDGTWGSWALRRPLAAASRSVLLFASGYSLPSMLILQACLVGAAAWLASRAVMAWRGIWAGVAFFSFTYIYVRIFVPTTLTEPLGLIFALLSVPFFIDSFRSHSLSAALIGFALTTLALMIRAGNMFAIPALVLWLVWQFGRQTTAKVRIALLAISIVASAFGLDSAIRNAYGSGRTDPGGNFSYVICGLTLGTRWEGCPKKLEEAGVVMTSEHDLAAKMYSMAWENFRADPKVLFGRLHDAVKTFLSKMPETILRGYLTKIDEPYWFSRIVLFSVMAAGILFVVIPRARSTELIFWALTSASLTASAAFVFFDDGTRVLAVSFPLIALFLAIGFTNPGWREGPSLSDGRLRVFGSVGVLLASFCLMALPWLSHRTYPADASQASLVGTEDFLVFGGKRMSGYLVVANSVPLPEDSPAIHLSDFEDMILQSGVEAYQVLIRPVSPPTPFGFVFAPRVEHGVESSFRYIVPPTVLERPEVPIWRFKRALWDAKSDSGLLYVTDATPWPIPAP
jgi:hypothetical protein